TTVVDRNDRRVIVQDQCWNLDQRQTGTRVERVRVPILCNCNPGCNGSAAEFGKELKEFLILGFARIRNGDEPFGPPTLLDHAVKRFLLLRGGAHRVVVRDEVTGERVDEHERRYTLRM